LGKSRHGCFLWSNLVQFWFHDFPKGDFFADFPAGDSENFEQKLMSLLQKVKEEKHIIPYYTWKIQKSIFIANIALS